MTQLIDIHRVSCNKQGWVVPAGENNSRNVLSETIAGPTLAHHSHTGLPQTRGTPRGFDGLPVSQPVRVRSSSIIEYGGQLGVGMILTFGDEPLTNTVSTQSPRCFATTPPRLLLGRVVLNVQVTIE